MADLHTTSDQPTDAERTAIDAVVNATMGPALLREGERLVRGGATRARERRHLLLPCLHALHNQEGWISPGGLNHIAEVLQVPPAEGYGVATFYEMFRTEKPGHDDDVHHVCVDAACQISGSAELAAQLRSEGRAVHESPCLGQCERPPALFIQGRAKPDTVPADQEPTVIPQLGHPSLKLLKRVGVVDPDKLESYIEHGGYVALPKAIQMGADAVIDHIAASGLRGRGGAAFPTGIKWRAVAAESGPSHVVANCDESEPGTFKDRTLLENDPFALIEAMTIAGLTVGAEHGWIYIRGEYPLATQRLQNAIDQTVAAGLLGPDVAGTGRSFTIEVRRGAGAYICGEETALFNSLEGYRGEPRNKPPFPTTNGLFDQPTAINNPETLFNVLDIVLDGGEAYAATGTAESSGTRLFCLSGHVATPGLYEVEFGATLRELLTLAGGMTGDFKAVLMGGAAGGFVGTDALDVPLTFEDTRPAGIALGSGVVMAFDMGTDFVAIVERIAQFFRNESCGQCVPCRVGVVRQHEVLVEMGRKPATERQAALIDDMAQAMVDASICGLGHTAASAVQSALALGLIGGAK